MRGQVSCLRDGDLSGVLTRRDHDRDRDRARPDDEQVKKREKKAKKVKKALGLL